jgi:hypothetical protein
MKARFDEHAATGKSHIIIIATEGEPRTGGILRSRRLSAVGREASLAPILHAAIAVCSLITWP